MPPKGQEWEPNAKGLPWARSKGRPSLRATEQGSGRTASSPPPKAPCQPKPGAEQGSELGVAHPKAPAGPINRSARGAEPFKGSRPAVAARRWSASS